MQFRLDFQDLESGDDGFCFTRTISNGVGLALSLHHNGDVEIFMTSTCARQLSEHLRDVADAVDEANSPSVSRADEPDEPARS
jgi:hypothetical protein